MPRAAQATLTNSTLTPQLLCDFSNERRIKADGIASHGNIVHRRAVSRHSHPDCHSVRKNPRHNSIGVIAPDHVLYVALFQLL